MENYKLQKFRKFLSNLDSEIDLANYADENTETFEDLADNIDFNLDIIYYYNAMKYLREHDMSLNKSLELAMELGYTMDNINSEVLASLLYSDIERNKFYALENEISTFLLEL